MKREFVHAYHQLAGAGQAPSFLFIGDSLLHVAAMNSFLDYARSRGRHLGGIVCNGIPAGRIAQFDETDLVYLDEGEYRYLFNRKDVDLREHVVESLLDPLDAHLRMMRRASVDQGVDPLSIDDTFYVLHPSTRPLRGYVLDFALSLGRPVCLVTLDEGIGTYVQDSRTWFELAVAKTSSPLLRAAKRIRWALQAPARASQERTLPTKSSHISFCIFDETNRDQAVVNDLSAPHYANAFAAMGRRRGVEPHDYEGAVVVASSQFEEFGVVDFEMDFLRSVIDVIHQSGHEAIVRPHPRDAHSSRYDALDALIDHNAKSSLETELSLSERHPAAILSFMSSAQVNSSALWSIPGASLSRIAASQLRQAGGNRDRVDHFLQTMGRAERYFSPFVKVPQGLDELQGILEAL